MNQASRRTYDFWAAGVSSPCRDQSESRAVHPCRSYGFHPRRAFSSKPFSSERTTDRQSVAGCNLTGLPSKSSQTAICPRGWQGDCVVKPPRFLRSSSSSLLSVCPCCEPPFPRRYPRCVQWRERDSAVDLSVDLGPRSLRCLRCSGLFPIPEIAPLHMNLTKAQRLRTTSAGLSP